GQRLRSQRDVEDRLVGRIDLLVGGRARHLGRQQRRGGGDGRLHVLRRSVDVAVEVEKERDLRAAERARGGHLLQAGDGGELPLEWRRHRGGHGLRVRARQLGDDEDRGQVDVGEVGDRKALVGRPAEDEERGRKQRGGDRASNEERGDAQGGGSGRRTSIPGCRRS